MPEQLTVRLPQDLSRGLKAAARHLERKPSEIVRMALRQFLELHRGSGGRLADRVRPLIGSLESGAPDLAENHRAYLLAAVKRGR